MAGYWPGSFRKKKNEGDIFSYLDQTSLVSKGFIIGLLAGSPERAR